MQFEAAEEHLHSAAGLGRRADDPSRRGVHAGALRDRVGRSLGGGRRRRTGLACRPASPARPRALARAGLRAADGRTPSRACVPGSPRISSAFASRRPVTPASRPSRESTRPRSSSYRGARRQRPWRRCRRRWRPASRRRRDERRVPGAADPGARRALRPGPSVARRRAGRRPRRGPRDETGHHPWPARRDRARAGFAHDAQVEAETGLLLVDAAAFRLAAAARGGDSSCTSSAEISRLRPSWRKRARRSGSPRIASISTSSWSPAGACGSPRARCARASPT